MSKKILILSSSPRRGGNSDTLCNEFMRGATDSRNQVEKIFLRDKTIHPCTGCSVCSEYKKPCPQKDDAAEIIEKMYGMWEKSRTAPNCMKHMKWGNWHRRNIR